MIQDSDDKTINSLNRQYALLLLQKIRFHNSNGTILSRFFTTIPTTITSIIIDIDYNISLSKEFTAINTYNATAIIVASISGSDCKMK
jgi:hypothetical protein